MTTFLHIAAAWTGIAVAAVTVWTVLRTRQKRAARARYTAEAQREALRAMCHRLAASSLAVHDQLVARGVCTPDCPRAWEWQLELQDAA
jgi:hypothetical protein